MHAISSYRGIIPTSTSTNTQTHTHKTTDETDYNTLRRSLARSVITRRQRRSGQTGPCVGRRHNLPDTQREAERVKSEDKWLSEHHVAQAAAVIVTYTCLSCTQNTRELTR